MGVLVWHILYQAHVHTPDSAASTGQHVQYVQVKFLKLPTSIFSRPGGNVVFHWYNYLVTVFVPSNGLEYI